MRKIAVVFWSGTGNTEIMAKAAADGAKEKGAEVTLFSPTEFDKEKVDEYNCIAFGCPAMGAEELEPEEFEPMFADLEGALDGKNIALFGSYGWGDGQWMREWEDRCRSAGAILVSGSVMAVETPDEKDLEECRSMGAALV